MHWRLVAAKKIESILEVQTQSCQEISLAETHQHAQHIFGRRLGQG